MNIRQLKSTVTLFHINLQRISDHLWRTLSGLPMAKRSLITPNIYLGGQYSPFAVTRFKELGITGIVNLRIHSIHNLAEAKKLNVLHLPTPDGYAPTQKQLEKGVQFIAQEIKNGGKVYIHCKYGEGRGPTMALAYLLYTGLTLEDAVAYVKKVRTFINPTPPQLAALRKFEASLQKQPPTIIEVIAQPSV